MDAMDFLTIADDVRAKILNLFLDNEDINR